MHVDTATPATTIARAPKRAKQSEPFGPEGSFPDHGVTLDFLRRFRSDPRLRTAMADLPLVLVVDIDGVPKARLSKPPTARRLGRLADAELRGLARQYRAFSAMDAVAEEAMYGASPSGGPPVFKACTKRHPLIAVQDDDDGGSCDHCGDAIPAATLQHGCETCGFHVCAACHGERTPINGREELLAVLRAPPTTTAHINLCIVRPDTLDVCPVHPTPRPPPPTGPTPAPSPPPRLSPRPPRCNPEKRRHHNPPPALNPRIVTSLHAARALCRPR